MPLWNYVQHVRVCLYLILLWLLIQFYITNLCVVELKYFAPNTHTECKHEKCVPTKWSGGEERVRVSERERGSERDEDDHSQCVCVLALQLPNDGSNIVQRPIVSINDMMHNFRAHPAAAQIPNNKIHAHDSKRLICSPHRCHQQNQTKTIYIKWWPNTIAQIIMNKTRCNRETQPRIRC